jgi:hypothetical protein
VLLLLLLLLQVPQLLVLLLLLPEDTLPLTLLLVVVVVQVLLLQPVVDSPECLLTGVPRLQHWALTNPSPALEAPTWQPAPQMAGVTPPTPLCYCCCRPSGYCHLLTARARHQGCLLSSQSPACRIPAAMLPLLHVHSPHTPLLMLVQAWAPLLAQ